MITHETRRNIVLCSATKITGLFFLVLLPYSLFSQVYTVGTYTVPTLIAGTVTDGGLTANYTINRTTSANWFNPEFSYVLGANGVQIRTKLDNEGVANSQTFTTNVAPVVDVCGIIICDTTFISHSAYQSNWQYNHPATHTLTWTGGGQGIIHDPDGQLTSHAHGQLITSGEVIHTCTNVPSSVDSWKISIPSNNVTLFHENTDFCAGISGYKMTYEWFNFAFSLECTAALPIELTDFSIDCTEDCNVLRWQTETERNNDYFDIEYSRDLVHFEKLTTIDGAGDSYAPIEYEYCDDINEKVYYRLKQVDYDGHFKYYGLETAQCERSSISVQLINGQLAFKGAQDVQNIEIYEMTGRMIYAGPPQDMNLNLAEQMYMIKMESSSWVEVLKLFNIKSF